MTQSPCLPELPKPFMELNREIAPVVYHAWADQMNAHYLKGYEAGSAAAAQAAWQPIGWQFRFVFPTHASNWHTVLRLPVTDMHSGDDYRYETRLVYAAAPTQGAEGAAPQAETADQDFLADVYEQCCEAIKPAVASGLLPGSVVESLQMLVAEKLAAPQAVVGEASEEALGIEDEAALTRAVSVMNDALTDISGWEDRALAEAIESSKVDLCAIIECIRMRADGSYVPGSRPIDGEAVPFIVAPTPTAPQEADALREALKACLDSLEYIDRAHPEVSGGMTRFKSIKAGRAALAQHQHPQGADRG